jgi:hypothetical protein
MEFAEAFFGASGSSFIAPSIRPEAAGVIQNPPKITTDNAIEFAENMPVNRVALPEDAVWKVFDRAAYDADPRARLIPVNRVVSRKDERADPKYVAGLKDFPLKTAYKRMVQNAHRKMPEPGRAPINVVEMPDGTFEIEDGNATTQVLMLAGWKRVPAIVQRYAPEELTAPMARGAEAPLARTARSKDTGTMDLFGESGVTNPAPKRKDTQDESTRPRRDDESPVRSEGDGLPGVQTDLKQPRPPAGVDQGELDFAAGGNAVTRPGRPDRSGAGGTLDGDGGSGAGALGGTGQEGAGSVPGGVSGPVRPGGSGNAAEPDRRLTRPAEGSPGRNAKIDPSRSYAPRQGKARFEANIEAIRLMRRCAPRRVRGNFPAGLAICRDGLFAKKNLRLGVFGSRLRGRPPAAEETPGDLGKPLPV